MQLFVKGSKTHLLELQGSETIEDLKSQLSQLENISVDDQYLVSGGVPLNGDSKVSILDNFATIDLHVRMLGGKVHGSLARAGKVKGQTPKVEKQEKKKQKTGRAKRRMQYNRRFVNVVAGFGRRRGPNANS